ncbi:Uncharacterized protein dnm_046270 [Desulfonema magnum]|uniref:Uncharacterized protein n=1 Tax=Desulfonema magnum TaxID=45655 RepID=A0A975BN91_9BACT|nr:Uncharacterized protein dnm_046270 [Desulfonema magnum]
MIKFFDPIRTKKRAGPTFYIKPLPVLSPDKAAAEAYHSEYIYKNRFFPISAKSGCLTDRRMISVFI